MAIAERFLSNTFNTNKHDIINHYTYVLASDGDIMEGVAQEAASLAGHLGISKLIVFYDSNKITIDGSTDLYLRPYYQQEYNDLFYEKMRKNDSKGNPTLMKWVRIQQVPKARVEVARPSSEAQMVLEEPFYVEQVKGAALGYQIVPFDPEGKHKDREPSLQAFHVPIATGQRVVRIRVQDKDGQYLPSSERQIRIITPARVGIISLILAVIPLVVMILVMARRSRKYTS